MSFSDINAKRVQHDSGAMVASYDRDTTRYILGDRTWYIDIERTVDGGVLYIPMRPRWDDGTYLTEDEVTTAVAILSQAFTHLKMIAYFEYKSPAGKNPIERPEFRARMKADELARAFPLE